MIIPPLKDFYPSEYNEWSKLRCDRPYRERIEDLNREFIASKIWDQYSGFDWKFFDRPQDDLLTAFLYVSLSRNACEYFGVNPHLASSIRNFWLYRAYDRRWIECEDRNRDMIRSIDMAFRQGRKLDKEGQRLVSSFARFITEFLFFGPLPFPEEDRSKDLVVDLGNGTYAAKWIPGEAVQEWVIFSPDLKVVKWQNHPIFEPGTPITFACLEEAKGFYRKYENKFSCWNIQLLLGELPGLFKEAKKIKKQEVSGIRRLF